MASLINRKPFVKIDDEYISLRELSKTMHSDPKTIKKYMAEMGWHFPFKRKDKDLIISYVNKRKEENKQLILNKPAETSDETSETVVQEKEEIPEQGPIDKLIQEKKDYGYHVSIRGSLGWIVVHIGPKDEMESWHKLFLRNDIESKVDENQKILMAYDRNLNS